jgi:channel protein (hemolysin III family)
LPGFHDPVSALSHLLGAVVFLCLTPGLLRRGWGDHGRVAYLAVYATSCVLLFSLSGVYHMMEFGGTARAVLRRLDQGAIFLLIAGTFTPVHGLLFRGVLRWGPLVIIWTLALAGITLNSIFAHDWPEWLVLSMYQGLGWVGAFSALLLWQRFGLSFVKPLLWGAVPYTVGAIMEFLEWFVLIPGVVGAHELFHVAVLLGASFHWRFVSRFASGKLPAERTLRDQPLEENSPGEGI